MPSDTLKERLSLLRRGQPVGSRPRPAASRARRGRSSRLSECFAEGAVADTPHGHVFVCELSLNDLHSNASRLTQSYLGAFERAAALGGDVALPAHLDLLRSTAPEATVLIDTETAGLHGRPLFLVGLARYHEGDIILKQYFARTYAEEAGLLAELADLLSEVKLLVSFNGKAFDWPFVRDRMVYHRLRCQPSFAHLDLLHPSRRRWRARLPNCRLQTLERYLCGRWRSGDIPGNQIPQRYHDFVREQDPALIAPVFHHNRLDLITMIELLSALISGSAPIPSASPGPADPAATAAAPSQGAGAKGAWHV